MKRKFLIGCAILISLFVLLFCFRLFYGYVSTPNGMTENQESPFFERFNFKSKNYASVRKKSSPGMPPSASSQKYEKIASIGSKSKKFEQDETELRQTIKQFDAMIQFEQNSGLKTQKNRRLNVGIGVKPDKFDEMVAAVRKIGTPYHISIDKTDKTNEYKDLNAKRASLVSMRAGLKSLKGKGSVEELIKLENRLLEIEEQIQNLGVSLGEFDEENEFCTVKFSLVEYTAAQPRMIPFLHRVKVALEWTIKYYASLMVILFFGALFILVSIIAIDKGKKLLSDNQA